MSETQESNSVGREACVAIAIVTRFGVVVQSNLKAMGLSPPAAKPTSSHLDKRQTVIYPAQLRGRHGILFPEPRGHRTAHSVDGFHDVVELDRVVHQLLIHARVRVLPR